jgi:carboxylesterase
MNTYLHNPHLAGEAFFLQGSGPNAALLFHGFTATCAEVAGLGRALQQAGYTVSAPLLPGHGTRPEDLNRTRWQDWTDAADAAYRELAAAAPGGRLIVAGESNGGLLALYLASRHPEIAAVLAFAPALRLPFGPLQRASLPLMARLLPALPKSDLEGNTTWQGYKVNPLRAVRELIRFQEVVRQGLGSIRQPLLVVQGRNDGTIDPRSAQEVIDGVGSAVKALHWLDRSGHCVLLEDEQDQAIRLALDFARAHVSAPAHAAKPTGEKQWTE